MPSFSRDVEETLHRTIAYANQRDHKVASLVHLLLALLDDPDARKILKGCKANISQMRENCNLALTEDPTEVAGNSPNQDSIDTESSEDAKPSIAFQRVIQRAVIHVQASGREEVNGANVLIAIFSERESSAAKIIEKESITRSDAVDYLNLSLANHTLEEKVRAIGIAVESAARSSPSFLENDGKIQYRPRMANVDIEIRKIETEERCEDLNNHCTSRLLNSHGEFCHVISRYRDKLLKTNANSSPVPLMLAAFDIERHLNIAASIPTDDDLNPPLSTSTRSKVAALLLAHAALMAAFPDAANISSEIDRYRDLSKPASHINEALLTPILCKIAEHSEIISLDTINITRSISEIGDGEVDRIDSTRAGISAKHNWARGLLTSLANYIIKPISGTAKVARDSIIKEGISYLFKNPDPLISNIAKLFYQIRDDLIKLSISSPSAFGWISSIYALFRG